MTGLVQGTPAGEVFAAQFALDFPNIRKTVFQPGAISGNGPGARFAQRLVHLEVIAPLGGSANVDGIGRQDESFAPGELDAVGFHGLNFIVIIFIAFGDALGEAEPGGFAVAALPDFFNMAHEDVIEPFRDFAGEPFIHSSQ